MDDQDDFQRALAGLSVLLIGREPVETTLTRVAELAVLATRGADGAAITLIDDDRPETAAASTVFAREIDALQAGLNEGPSLTAALDRAVVTSGSLGGDMRWPRFGGRAARLGVWSTLVIPLLLPDSVVGTINLYALRKNSFNPHAVERAEAFSAGATATVHNALVLERSMRLVDQLSAAIASRKMIDQAVGVLMSKLRVDPDVAFTQLRGVSNREGIRLHEVARRVLDDVAGPPV